MSQIEGYLDSTEDLKDYDGMEYKEKMSLCMDELFAVYLREISWKSNENSFIQFTRFIILLREHINSSAPETELPQLTSKLLGSDIPDHFNSFINDFYDLHPSLF